MASNVRPDQLALHTTDQRVLYSAVCEGVGLGFLAEHDACVRTNLVEVIAPSDAWSTALWVVTHVDLHRTTKVQAFLQHLKAHRSGDTPARSVTPQR
jgi:DNA-binding transcriptional LysR family regulator